MEKCPCSKESPVQELGIENFQKHYLRKYVGCMHVPSQLLLLSSEAAC